MRILSRWDLKFDVIIYFQIVQYSTEVVNFIRTLDCCRKVWSQPQTCDLRSTATTNNNYEIKKRWRETLWFLLNIEKFCLRSEVRPQPQPKFGVWFFLALGMHFENLHPEVVSSNVSCRISTWELIYWLKNATNGYECFIDFMIYLRLFRDQHIIFQHPMWRWSTFGQQMLTKIVKIIK